MQPQYELNGEIYTVSPVRMADVIYLSVNGREIELLHQLNATNEGVIVLNGHHYPYCVAQSDNTLYLHLHGQHHRLDIVDAFVGAHGDAANASGAIKAPMPGVVDAVYVEVGQGVQAGDVILLIESMKLQTEIKATCSGEIAELPVAVGASFEKGALLVVLATQSEDA